MAPYELRHVCACPAQDNSLPAQHESALDPNQSARPVIRLDSPRLNLDLVTAIGLVCALFRAVSTCTFY